VQTLQTQSFFAPADPPIPQHLSAIKSTQPVNHFQHATPKSKMPLVEILTTSKSHTTPGWAYVPDTSFRSSQATKASAGGRKRGIREPAGRTTNLTSRQNQAIIRHLAELDRENHRENVHIAVPARKDSQKVDHGRPTKSKMTSNVRRILQSQKTFKNHLDDEEAALAHQASMGVMGRQAGVGASASGGGVSVAPAPAATVAGTPVSKVAKTSSGRRSVTPITAKPAAPPVDPPVSNRQKRAKTRKSLLTVTPAESTPTKEKGQEEAAKEAAPKTKEEEKEENPSTETADGDDDAMQIDTPVIKGLIKTTYDNDPLLKSHLPRPPTDRVMAALLAEPPLTYNSARARPSASGKPARYFCTICGYWGKIKCKNCGVRMCGLDCYKVHEDSRCGAFF
jgi:zinc finger HIT domain-containing protein 1